MANKEACEIYIEQQIEEGLSEGKTPYTLGQEISAWIAKFLEVKIKPGTIKKRAERQKSKLGTNVANESNNRINLDSYKSKSSVTSPPTERGGPRAGAGRPKSHRPNIDQLKANRPSVEVRRMIDKFHNFVNDLDMIKGGGVERLTNADRKVFDQEFRFLIPRLLRILTEMGIDIDSIMQNYVHKIRRIVERGKQEAKNQISLCNF